MKNILNFEYSDEEFAIAFHSYVYTIDSENDRKIIDKERLEKHTRFKISEEKYNEEFFNETKIKIKIGFGSFRYNDYVYVTKINFDYTEKNNEFESCTLEFPFEQVIQCQYLEKEKKIINSKKIIFIIKMILNKIIKIDSIKYLCSELNSFPEYIDEENEKIDFLAFSNIIVYLS